MAVAEEKGRGRAGERWRERKRKQELENTSARSDSEACSRKKSDNDSLVVVQHANAVEKMTNWSEDMQPGENGPNNDRRSETKTPEERERLAGDDGFT